MIHFLSETKAVAGAARVPCPVVPAAQTLHAGKAVAVCPSRGVLAAWTPPWNAICELISAGAAHSGPKVQGSHSVTAMSHSRENKCCWQGNCLGIGQGGAWETLYALVLWESRHGRRCLLGQVLSEPHLIIPVCQGFPGALGEVLIPSSLYQLHSR